MMAKSDNKVLVKNTIMMYLMSIAKIVIPLISLPYLVRVLSVDCYGSVSFVKSVTAYMQIIIDFGFMLSATKDLVLHLKEKRDPSKMMGNTLYAQLILCAIAFAFVTGCIFIFDILEGLELFTYLYFLNCVLSIFMFEYIFKAHEKMEKISIRYVIMKIISLVLTLIFVKNDGDIILMPIFDIVATLVAIGMGWFNLKKMGVKINFSFKRIKEGFSALKKSFTYFLSSFATTAFSVLNTLIIGYCLTEADVAFWSLAIQMVAVIQCLYDPIITSVFPNMVKNKNLKIIHRILLIYMPLIFCGCGAILLLGDFAVGLVFGKAYLTSAKLLKCLIPLLIFSFPAMLYGWPCLGAINKQKATTLTTVIAACVQVLGLVFLMLIDQFSLIGIVIVRNVTEFVLWIQRMSVTYKNKHLFNAEENQNKMEILQPEEQEKD